MKNYIKSWKIMLAIAGIVLGFAGAPVSVAFADGGQKKAVSPSDSIYGMSYGDWSAAWWQYVLSIPIGANPVLDTTGANCGVGQSSGPVFFRVGAATTDPVPRTCAVSAGKALFFPIINAECSTVEPDPFHGDDGQELRTCVGGVMDGVDIKSLKVTVDKKKLSDLKSFRVQSPLFDFVMPSSNNYLGLNGVTAGSSVSDGYWIMLKPLSPGSHEIHFKAKITSGIGAGFSQDVTYNLTVAD
ncbi:MAG: hypothetical protein U0586_17125 [Candidatus Brocadiaceae bacterium]